ncbi:hypothetical protein CIB48_g391 [Xylaria polymorpha]|nr:hypothetical protein CIB48_g391 [Xylaria polymorpha]
MSSAATSRKVDYPVVDAVSDGANDEVPSPANPNPNPNLYTLPRYDATKDADAVPKYTRGYLQSLSTAIDTRLRNLDDATAYYPEAFSKTKKVYKGLMILLVVLGLLWLATAIVIVVAIFKGSGVSKRLAQGVVKEGEGAADSIQSKSEPGLDKAIYLTHDAVRNVLRRQHEDM